MTRLSYITSLIVLTLFHISASSQSKGFDPEKLYRPVYGYVIDTCSNLPMEGVMVYGFDSIDDAQLGKHALMESSNPLKIKMKGEVVETRTDDTGRYMIPALGKGAVVFWFKDKKSAVIEEIAGRSEVSLGKKVKEWSVYDLDLDKYTVTPETGRKKSRLEPVGVELNMDFKCYLPYLGSDAGDSRIKVERRVIDLDTGETLACHIPVVRDGKQYHKRSRSMTSKKVINDTLLSLAESSEPLTEKTSDIRVKESFNTDQWKNHCFRIGYFVIQEKGDEIRNLDTLYMLTNRISRPLKYMEYRYEPYTMVYTPKEENHGRQIRRRLVVQGEYTGRLPEVLQDSTYQLKELHVRADVSSCDSYQSNIAKADSLVNWAMAALREEFSSKLSDQVRVTMTSASSSQQDEVTYRLVFSSDRRFSPNAYAEAFAKAQDCELDSLYRRAIDESRILEGKSWDYAANLLASSEIRKGIPAPGLLEEFVDTTLKSCDVVYEDRVMDVYEVRNRKEIVADQVVMLMLAGRYEEAAALASILPERYLYLQEWAKCKAGFEPSSKTSIDILSRTSLRNGIVMDIYTGEVDSETFAALAELSDEDPYKWYLNALALCVLYDNDMADMQGSREGASCSVYEEVKQSLAESFRLDPAMKDLAAIDGDINEYALKEVIYR